MSNAEGETPTPSRLLTAGDILKISPVTKTTLNNWEKRGIFPKGKKLGGGSTSKRTWNPAVVFRWIEERGEGKRNPDAGWSQNTP